MERRRVKEADEENILSAVAALHKQAIDSRKPCPAS